jgi:hypothetical protein
MCAKSVTSSIGLRRIGRARVGVEVSESQHDRSNPCCPLDTSSELPLLLRSLGLGNEDEDISVLRDIDFTSR